MINNKKKIILIIIGIILVLFIVYVIYKNIKQSSNELNFNILLDDNTQSVQEEKSENIVENSTDKLSKTAEKNNIEENKKIVIHITGEVKKEGVIYLKEGARIIDAIKEAGGETKEADLSQVNLAYELQDGQKIYIPNKNEKIEQYIISANGENIKSSDGDAEDLSFGKGGTKVNINTATQNELDSLPGIGPALAQRIIDYREENGNFNAIEDLQNVKGIGDSKYEDIKDKIVV